MTTSLTPADDWTVHAACRGAPTELFMPGDSFDEDEDEPPYPSREAKAYCDRCPVRSDCLTHALATDERGTWGGTSTYQREQLRRPRGRVVCPVCSARNTAKLGEVEYCLSCGATWPLPQHVVTR